MELLLYVSVVFKLLCFILGVCVSGFLASNWWLAKDVQMPREIAS